MTPDKPRHPTADLLAYWLNELDQTAADAIDEHLFECDGCGARLRELLRVGGAIRRELLGGNVSTVVTEPFIRRLRDAGLRIREYNVQPGDSVNCTIAPDDDLVFSQLHAPFGELRQVDLVFDDPGGGPVHRARHIPFNAAAGKVTFIPPVTALRTLGHATQRMRLVSVENGAERVLGEYIFNHSPHGV
jgi:hypothetical protein